MNAFSEFSRAAMFGDYDSVKAMLSENPSLLHEKDEYGFTVLHNIMSEEQDEILEYLITQGADVNTKNNEGITPLHLACWPEGAAILMKLGGDMNETDNNGRTPLHVMASDGEERYEMIEFLLRKGANRDLKDKWGKKPVDISRRREDKRNVRLFEGK